MQHHSLKVIKFNRYQDKNGELIPFYINNLKKINFKLDRFFFVFGKKKTIRADHGHKKCVQLIIPINGNIKIYTYKNKKRKTFKLNRRKREALLVPTYTWIRIEFEKKNDCLLVLCNYKYDKKEYITSFKQFMEEYF